MRRAVILDFQMGIRDKSPYARAILVLDWKEYPLIFKAAFPNCAGCLDKKCAMNLYFNDKGEHEHE